jgi:hypothetical protein
MLKSINILHGVLKKKTLSYETLYLHAHYVHKSLLSHLHVINYTEFSSAQQGLQQTFFLSSTYTNLSIWNAYNIFCSAKDSISHICEPVVCTSTDTLHCIKHWSICTNDWYTGMGMLFLGYINIFRWFCKKKKKKLLLDQEWAWLI